MSDQHLARPFQRYIVTSWYRITLSLLGGDLRFYPKCAAHQANAHLIKALTMTPTLTITSTGNSPGVLRSSLKSLLTLYRYSLVSRLLGTYVGFLKAGVQVRRQDHQDVGASIPPPGN